MMEHMFLNYFSNVRNQDAEKKHGTEGGNDLKQCAHIPQKKVESTHKII
jgi:hypothetical protein